jgi:hypothetical protein
MKMFKEANRMGPIEYIVVEFPGNQFKGEIAPALAELVNNGTIRIIDLVFIKKDADGRIKTFELSDLAHDEAAVFEALEGEIDGLLNEEDISLASEMLQSNSSAAIMVFENVWAARLSNAIIRANGRLVDNARIPAAVAKAALEAAGIVE